MLRVLAIVSLVSQAFSLATKSSASHSVQQKEQVFMFKDASAFSKVKLPAVPDAPKLDLEDFPKEFNAPLVNILRVSVFINVAICFLWFGSKRSGDKERGDVRKENSYLTTSPATPSKSPHLHVTMGSSCLYEPAPKPVGYVPSRSVKSSPINLALSSPTSTHSDITRLSKADFPEPTSPSTPASSFTTKSSTPCMMAQSPVKRSAAEIACIAEVFSNEMMSRHERALFWCLVQAGASPPATVTLPDPTVNKDAGGDASVVNALV